MTSILTENINILMPKTVTVKQFSEIMGMCKRSVRRYCQKNKYPRQQKYILNCKWYFIKIEKLNKETRDKFYSNFKALPYSLQDKYLKPVDLSFYKSLKQFNKTDSIGSVQEVDG